VKSSGLRHPKLLLMEPRLSTLVNVLLEPCIRMLMRS
jgi:hypothetical protein